MKTFFKYFFVSLIFVVLLFGLFIFLFGSSKSPFYVPKEDVRVKNYTYVCEENWFCTGWGPCIGGSNKRNCVDLNSCGTTDKRPELSRECEVGGTVYYDPAILTKKASSNKNYSKNQGGSIESEEDFKNLQNCETAVVPICGYAYPELVSDYNEDCSLSCFGEGFFDSCSPSKVYLQGIEGSSISLESFGMDRKSCSIEMKVIKAERDYPQFEGKNLVCNIPYEGFPILFKTLNGADLTEKDLGSSTMTLFSAMLIESTENPSKYCTGTMLDV